MANAYPVRPSFWGEAEPTGPLSGDRTADVAVVGAGLAGMSCAYYLKKAQPELDVVLLEERYAGYGSSGRNFGNVPQVSRQALGQLVERLDRDDARAFVEHEARMLDDYEAFLREEGIDGEFERVDCLLLAHRPQAFADLRELRSLHEEFDFPSELLEPADVRRYVNISNCGGLSCGRNGYQQPFKLCRGFAAAIRRAGISLYEATPVSSYDEADTVVTLETPAARVRARQAVFAMDSFSYRLGLLPNDVIPGFAYVIATEPLDADRSAELGWAKRHRVVLDMEPLESYFFMQLRPEGHFLFGGSSGLAQPGVMPALDDQPAYRRLHSEMLRRFPFLADCGIEAAWGGPLGFTATGSPMLARLSNRTVVAAGFNGRGALIGALVGRMIRGMVLGAEYVDPDYAWYAETLRRVSIPRH